MANIKVFYLVLFISLRNQDTFCLVGSRGKVGFFDGSEEERGCGEKKEEVEKGRRN